MASCIRPVIRHPSVSQDASQQKKSCAAPFFHGRTTLPALERILLGCLFLQEVLAVCTELFLHIHYITLRRGSASAMRCHCRGCGSMLCASTRAHPVTSPTSSPHFHFQLPYLPSHIGLNRPGIPSLWTFLGIHIGCPSPLDAHRNLAANSMLWVFPVQWAPCARRFRHWPGSP